MANREQADRALQEHQDILIENPNVAYVSTVNRNDDEAMDEDYVIEVGLIEEELEIYDDDDDDDDDDDKLIEKLDFQKIPTHLTIPSEGSATVAEVSEEVETIEVEVVVCGEIAIQSFQGRRRPAEGGNSCGNWRRKSAGTLGMSFQSNGQIYILSNWHVLYGNGGVNGDPIVQQGRKDGGRVPIDIIAHNTQGWLDRYRDAAIASVRSPWNAYVASGTRCYGALNGFGIATNNMNVKKCGRTTRGTTGVVRSTNATVKVSGYPNGIQVFENQIQLTLMSAPGDSGSVILDQQNNTVVGLLFAGGSGVTFANNIQRIFNIGNAGGATDDVELIEDPTLELSQQSEV